MLIAYLPPYAKILFIPFVSTCDPPEVVSNCMFGAEDIVDKLKAGITDKTEQYCIIADID